MNIINDLDKKFTAFLININLFDYNTEKNINVAKIFKTLFTIHNIF